MHYFLILPPPIPTSLTLLQELLVYLMYQLQVNVYFGVYFLGEMTYENYCWETGNEMRFWNLIIHCPDTIPITGVK